MFSNGFEPVRSPEPKKRPEGPLQAPLLTKRHIPTSADDHMIPHRNLDKLSRIHQALGNRPTSASVRVISSSTPDGGGCTGGSSVHEITASMRNAVQAGRKMRGKNEVQGTFPIHPTRSTSRPHIADLRQGTSMSSRDPDRIDCVMHLIGSKVGIDLRLQAVYYYVSERLRMFGGIRRRSSGGWSSGFLNRIGGRSNSMGQALPRRGFRNVTVVRVATNSCVILAAAAAMLLCSCSAGKFPLQPFYKGLPDEQQIVSIVFDEMLGDRHCGGWPSYETQTRYNLRERFRDRDAMMWILDSLKSLPDSVRCIVYVEDTTISISGRFFGCPGDTGKQWRPALAVDPRLPGIDASWYPLICRWQEFSRASKPFDVSWVHTRYRYRVRNARSYDARVDIFEPVSVRFSVVAFDDEGARACMYTRMHCGPLCASEDMWFLRNTTAGWILEEVKNLSRS
jgi:hypothetical protein